MARLRPDPLVRLLGQRLSQLRRLRRAAGRRQTGSAAAGAAGRPGRGRRHRRGERHPPVRFLRAADARGPRPRLPRAHRGGCLGRHRAVPRPGARVQAARQAAAGVEEPHRRVQPRGRRGGGAARRAVRRPAHDARRLRAGDVGGRPAAPVRARSPHAGAGVRGRTARDRAPVRRRQPGVLGRARADGVAPRGVAGAQGDPVVVAARSRPAAVAVARRAGRLRGVTSRRSGRRASGRPR